MISIIVPIYKAEKTLRRCLDSIIQQDITDWELLLIDDGSPDNSGHICDEYAAKDSRVKVFHKPNGGVSSARNLGLDNAKGEWITFVDADDSVSDSYLSVVTSSSADLIMVAADVVCANTEHKPLYNPSLNYYDEKECQELLTLNLYTSTYKTPWAKFIKRDVIGDTRFRINQRLGEDSLFMYDIYAKISGIMCNPNATYYWTESDVVDRIKYKMSTAEALSNMSAIISSYRKIGIESPCLESNYLGYFFTLIDKEDFKENKSLWFDSDFVKSMQMHARKDWPFYRYFFYCMWKFPSIAAFVDSLRLSVRRAFAQL